MTTHDFAALAERISRRCSELGETVAVAESLTSGALASELGKASDAASWFRGGIVAYASGVKRDVLAVPPGPVVSGAAALRMARSTARLLHADAVVAVTGAAGPDPQDAQPPGTVWFGVVRGKSELVTSRHCPGDPTDVVEATVRIALELLADSLEKDA